ncbi:hypothetical protein K8S17_04035 [bacterium]|nr:hypothetical protein [bacterium]
MRKLMFAAIVPALVLLVAMPAAASNYMYGTQGLGSMMKSPVVYSGTFIFGFSGTWEVQIDDSLWPGQADSTARFDHIWTNFFADNYDATNGAEAWYGYFDGVTQPVSPSFMFDFASSPIGPGAIAGNASVVIMVRDWYADGILSQDEKHGSNQMTVTYILNPDAGTGAFADHCGNGSMSGGNFNFVNPPADDSINLMGQFSAEFCGSPVEQSSWGVIKALYN